MSDFVTTEHDEQKWREAIDAVSEALEAGSEPESVAKRVIRNMPAATRSRILFASLIREARDAIRRRTITAERSAQQGMSYERMSYQGIQQQEDPTMIEPEAPCVDEVGAVILGKNGRPVWAARHGGSSASEIRRGAWAKGCRCEECAMADAYLEELRLIDERTQERLWSAISNAVRDYTENLKMEWTAELLRSQFGLRDGTLVTWGDATIEQHQERVLIFTENAAANIEGAARHAAAIQAIENANGRCLNDLGKLAA